MTDARVTVDLGDPDSFVEGPPHEWFAELRRDEPAWWQEEADGRGFWNLTRYQDVVAASRDTRRFSSWVGCTQIETPEGEILDQTRLLMLNMDPPDHTRMRLLLNRGFTPRMVAVLEPRIRAAAHEIVDSLSGRATCDFVEDVAAELPLRVIGDLLGVPASEQHAIFEWTNLQIGNQDPEFQTAAGNGGLESMQAMCAYASELAAEKRRAPTDDLVSLLVADEAGLSEAELQQFFVLLAVAGNETTRNLISHGMLALVEHPDARRQLAEDHTRLPAAIEEMLRWATPVMHFRRTATVDVDIAGRRIAAGDRVVIWYTSANRDEDVFEDPGRFDIARQPNPHLAFGGTGPHFCLGAHLARLEIRVMFEVLLERLSEIRLDGPVQRLRSNFIHGIKHLPVAFELAPAKAGA